MTGGFWRVALIPLLIVSGARCAPSIAPTEPPEAVRISDLWEPAPDAAAQPVRYGPWGQDLAPDPHARYRFVKAKQSGVNPGMTVIDDRGREWSVKQPPIDGDGAEGPIEVVVSRILSTAGYRQPPVYFLPSFTLVDSFGTRREPGGRFRLKHPALKELDTWSWQRNPFVGTRPYQGLLVILLLLNSSDLKNENNSLYRYTSADGTRHTWYVVRDVGTSLGETGRFRPRRGDIDRFEHLPFIAGVYDGLVAFHYAGRHQELIRGRITPGDVGWACDLLARFTPRQWREAFEAGGYAPEVADRYIARLRAKIAEGQAIRLRRGSGGQVAAAGKGH